MGGQDDFIKIGGIVPTQQRRALSKNEGNGYLEDYQQLGQATQQNYYPADKTANAFMQQL